MPTCGYRDMVTCTHDQVDDLLVQVKNIPYPFWTERFKRALKRSVREMLQPHSGYNDESKSLTGGIAQLAERQLCKLDVAGSTPAASTNFCETKIVNAEC